MADHDPNVPATTSRKVDANATLTRTVGRTGIDDGGHGSNTRTRP